MCELGEEFQRAILEGTLSRLESIFLLKITRNGLNLAKQMNPLQTRKSAFSSEFLSH